MDDNDHKNTWEGFTKFVLWGTILVIANSGNFSYNFTIKIKNDYWFYKRRFIIRKKNCFNT